MKAISTLLSLSFARTSLSSDSYLFSTVNLRHFLTKNNTPGADLLMLRIYLIQCFFFRPKVLWSTLKQEAQESESFVKRSIVSAIQISRSVPYDASLRILSHTLRDELTKRSAFSVIIQIPRHGRVTYYRQGLSRPSDNSIIHRSVDTYTYCYNMI